MSDWPKCIVGLVLCCGSGGDLLAQNNWLGTQSKFWRPPGNWSLGHIPQNNEALNFPNTYSHVNDNVNDLGVTLILGDLTLYTGYVLTGGMVQVGPSNR